MNIGVVWNRGSDTRLLRRMANGHQVNAKHDNVVYGEEGLNLAAHWAAPRKHEVIFTVFGDIEVIDDLDKYNATWSDKVRNPTARKMVISL